MKIPKSKIAVTLFNLREYCKNEDDLDRTLEKVRAIGYEAIQVSGIGPIQPQKVKQLADKHGLFICATHESISRIRENFDAIVEKHQIYECDFTAAGSSHPAFDWTEEGIEPFINELADIGQRFKEKGIKFGYHNHHSEFQRFNGKTLLDHIYSNTCPDVLCAEIDIHWVQRGGGDPIEWIHKVAGRMPVVHFKDFVIVDNEPHFCEIGEGNLNMKNIVEACVATQVRWYSVEQDQPFGDKDIFESIRISYENLKKLGVD